MILWLTSWYWITNLGIHPQQRLIFSLSSHQLPGLFCLRVEPHNISFVKFRISTDIISVELLSKQYVLLLWYHGYNFPIISRKESITADFLVFCFLKSFQLIFLEIPRDLGAEIVAIFAYMNYINRYCCSKNTQNLQQLISTVKCSLQSLFYTVDLMNLILLTDIYGLLTDIFLIPISLFISAEHSSDFEFRKFCICRSHMNEVLHCLLFGGQLSFETVISNPLMFFCKWQNSFLY